MSIPKLVVALRVYFEQIKYCFLIISDCSDSACYILDKTLKIRLNKNAISDVFPKLFSTFEPVLANKYKQSIIDKTSEKWYMSRKLDGVRCLILINKKTKPIKSFSRTGKVFTTLGVLHDSLLEHIDDFKESVVLDGEIIYETDGQENFKKLMERL